MRKGRQCSALALLQAQRAITDIPGRGNDRCVHDQTASTTAAAALPAARTCWWASEDHAACTFTGMYTSQTCADDSLLRAEQSRLGFRANTNRGKLTSGGLTFDAAAFTNCRSSCRLAKTTAIAGPASRLVGSCLRTVNSRSYWCSCFDLFSAEATNNPQLNGFNGDFCRGAQKLH